MSKIIEDIKHSVDSTIPEVEDLSHMVHPKIDYTFFVLRNGANIQFRLKTQRNMMIIL